MEDELIVRVLKTPHFFKKGALTAAAFRPQRGFAELSTIRWLDREHPDRKVKERCLLIGNTGKHSYWGVARLTAGDCLQAALRLNYTPEEYPGHTDVVFPAAFPPDEPLEGELFVQQSEIVESLLQKAQTIIDPEAQSLEWTISPDVLPLDRR